MDSEIQITEMKFSAKEFLDILCEKAQLLCKPSSSPSPEDEFQACSKYFESFENHIIGKTDLNIISTNIKSSICGKIFKAREPVYICRDCATDETCVLCRQCFTKSEHYKHNYEMHASAGGGYCDCGDEEAWKAFFRCNLHGDSLKSSSSDSQDQINFILEDISIDIKLNFLTVCTLIFENFKRFVMRPHCKMSPEKRVEELKKEQEFAMKQLSKSKSKELALVLYNNEYHNFDQVITLFKRCLQCTTEQAMTFANIVDRDGRCVALVSIDRTDVDTKRNDIGTRSKHQTTMELLCRIHHPLILSLQNILIHCLRWLYEFVDKYPKLRVFLCTYLFSETDIKLGNVVFKRSTFIQDIFENHVELWKASRNVCTTFLMTAIFKETYFKKLFVVKVAQNYKMILDHYSTDDHNPEDSLISLNCQLFTVISFAKYLLESHNFLDDIMQIVYKKLLDYSKPLRHSKLEGKVILHFEKEEIDVHKKFDPFERQMKALSDLRFLLKSLASAYFIKKETNEITSTNQNFLIWPENGVENLMKYFETFANFLSLIQDTDTIERVTEHHVEHDPNWKTGVVMMYDSINIITPTAKLVIANRICWDRAFSILRQIFKTRIVDLEYKFSQLFSLFSFKTEVIANEWPSKFISVVKPLHRFMAVLLIDSKYRNLLDSSEKDCLLDQALQIVVFCSQQAGNMWIRNGSVPYILTQQIKCLPLVSEMFDRDLQLIQQIAISIPPESFILKCIHKFDLKGYLEADTCKQADRKALLQRTEDFLHTLIMTLFFRHRVEIGKNITKKDIYAHTIFHILSIKSMSHSKLMKKLTANLQKYPKGKLMNIIDKVADQSLSSQVVIFNAKKSLILSNFDRYVPYYSVQDRNEAELFVKNLLKKESLSMTIHPPVPIDLADDCVSLLNYMSSPCFVELLNKFLYFSITKKNGEFWTDTILDMVLYLIGASLLEDTKLLESSADNKRPLFIDTCANSSNNADIIGNLELLCDKITCDQQLDLIKWTIRKWNDVQRLKTSGKNISECMDVDIEGESDTAQVLDQTKIAKADAAKKRREQLMSKMSNMQKKFINENFELLTEKNDLKTNITDDRDHVDSYNNNQKKLDLVCILCQERNTEENNDRPIVLIAGAWRSAVLAKHPFINKLPSGNQCSSVNSLESCDIDRQDVNLDNVFYPLWTSVNDEENNSEIDRAALRSIIPMLDHAEETFITTCGHVMHYDCKTIYTNNMIKLKQNVARTKGVLYPRIYNRCPLCKCVCNIDIPIIRTNSLNNEFSLDRNPIFTTDFKKWIDLFNQWAPNSSVKTKKIDGSIRWWNKLGSQLSAFIRHTSPSRSNDSSVTDEELLSCMAYRTSLAIKLQPGKLSKETYKNFENLRSSISESSSQELIELDYALIYTISVWDKIMSKQNSSILIDIPERHLNGLKYLLRAVCKSHQRFANNEIVSHQCQSFFMLLHQILFDCTTASFHKAWLELNKFQIPLFIFEVDFTFVLGSMLLLRHSLANGKQLNPIERELFDKNNYNFYIVKFIYQFIAVQALLSIQNTALVNVDITLDQLKTHNSQIWTDKNIEELYYLRESLSQQLNYCKSVKLSPNEVAVGFSKSVLSFLRIAAFLLHEMGSVEIPASFTHSDAEFNEILNVLRLDLIPFNKQDCPLWINNHLKLINDSKIADPKTFWNTPLPHVMPISPPKLIDLPNEFTEVITMGLDKGCSLSQQSTGTVSEMSICLICGVTVCLSGYCCRRIEESTGTAISGAQIHTRQCHEGYSLFLNTRTSKVIVLFYQARWHINLDPIYLDKFGESDVDLKRGNPLFLNQEAYAKLERNWLDHSIGCVVNDGFFSTDFFV